MFSYKNYYIILPLQSGWECRFALSIWASLGVYRLVMTAKLVEVMM